MAHIFISYSRKNQPYARRLAEHIRKAGFDIWIDDRIDYGDQWFSAITDAIQQCAAFVVVMTPDAEKSEWVHKEILVAKREKKPIFPVLLEGREFSLLIDIQSVNVTGEKMPPDDFLRRLKTAIQPGRESGTYVAPPVETTKPAPRAERPRWLFPALIGVVLIAVVGLLAILSNGTNTPDPLQVALTPVTRNEDWTPIEREFDGVTMVLVPAGCFMMGSTDEQIDYAVNELGADRNWMDDEQPVEEICFDEPFWIDKYEVTQAQFRELGGVQATSSAFSGDDRPVEQITWFDARDFCEARGGSLPTEAQWEYAARGPSAWVYPWGDDFISENAVYDSNSGNHTSDVGSRPGGASWVGAVDMSGNVLEWTSSLYRDYPYGADHESNTDTNSIRVLRGGSWLLYSDSLRSAYRYWIQPDIADWFYGFRCVRS